LLELIGEMRRRKAPRQRTVELELADEELKLRAVQCDRLQLVCAAICGATRARCGRSVSMCMGCVISARKASHKRNAEFVSGGQP